MSQTISDTALDAFLQCWFTGMGKTGALDTQQIARFRGKLMSALDAMHEAERRSSLVAVSA